MVNEMIAGISVKLQGVFGDDIKVYTSNDTQGLQEPYFFIKLLTVTNTPLLSKRKMRTYPFDVHFIPVEGTENEEVYGIAEQLAEELEYITLMSGDMIRGKDISFELRDGVLHFYITYAEILYDPIKEEEMDGFGLEVGVKG